MHSRIHHARKTGSDFDAFPRHGHRLPRGSRHEVQGAAGSSYVEIPVQLYGQMKNGESFGSAGTVTLRRVNDVPGATAAQRRWRIYTSE